MSQETREIFVVAPMPGKIVSIEAKVGDVLKKGDAILTYEAMKMKNVLRAPENGTLKLLNVAIGQSIKKFDVLAVLTSIRTIHSDA